MSMVDMRRKPLLENEDYSSHGGVRKVRMGEVVGGTTAECAAVCCCGPASVVGLVVLATCKVPAGLCRKALRRKRRRTLMKKGLLPPLSDDKEIDNKEIHALAMVNDDKEVVELDKEMFDKFYGTGFWRSPSQSGIEDLLISLRRRDAPSE